MDAEPLVIVSSEDSDTVTSTTNLVRSCGNSDPRCNIASHRHEDDVVLWKNLLFKETPIDTLLSETNNPRSLISLLLSPYAGSNFRVRTMDRNELPAAVERLVSPEILAQQPQCIQELMHIFSKFIGEFYVAFQTCAIDLHLVNLCSEDSLQKMSHDVAAQRELLATHDTSRELIREQFTSIRDIIEHQFYCAIIYNTKRCVDSNVFKAAARATLPSLLRGFFRDYMSHRDQERLLQEISKSCEDVIIK